MRPASRPRRASPPLPPQLRPSGATEARLSSKRRPSPQRPTHHRPSRRSDPVLPLRHLPTLNKPVSALWRPSPAPVIDADPSSVRRESSNRTTPTTTPQVSHRSPSPSNRPSVVKQTPSPPPDDCRRSFPATPQAYQPTSEMRPRFRSASSLALSGSTPRPPPPSPSLSSGILGIKTYQYASLGEMEFRLVRILPARSSKIKCEIIHASIEDAPNFVSISYAWGDA
jgi:hypothetical protein